jgi:hypothetical protein
MLTTRILLLGMPLMLRQLLVQIVAQVPSIDIVAELADDNLLSAKVLETPADFVVIDSDRRRGGRLTGDARIDRQVAWSASKSATRAW